jgi:uncharacterized membrane protein
MRRRHVADYAVSVHVEQDMSGPWEQLRSILQDEAARARLTGSALVTKWLGSGIMMLVGMALFLGAIILGIALLIPWSIRSADRGRSAQEEGLGTESPMEILERRFTEAENSVEDYRKRREVLVEVNGAVEPNGAHKHEPLATPRAREGR